MLGFSNVKTYVEGKGIVKTNVAIKGDKIVDIGEDVFVDHPFPHGEDDLIVPGFIDEHVHGANNSDGMDGTVKDIKNIANTLAKEGTTGFLVTTMTQSKENISRSLNAVKEYVATNETTGAKVLGVHLEGPFISDKHIGAQPLKYLANPDIKVFDEYNKISGNNIKIVSLAPELNGSPELIKHLKELSVISSCGHADACYSDIERAIKCGLSTITHTFNAQKGIHHREIGTAGSALLFDELYVEMICDLVHLSAPAIRLILKNKPKDKVILITDSMRAKGLDDGISELGGQKVIVKNGEARLENGALAGSILKMNDAIKNVYEKCGASLTDAIDFATINPAKNLGLDKVMGGIKKGKQANFAVLYDGFKVRTTVRDGRVIHF